MDGLTVIGVLLGLFWLVAPMVALVMGFNHKARIAVLAADNAGLRARLERLERDDLHIVEPAPAADVPEAEPMPLDELPPSAPDESLSVAETQTTEGWAEAVAPAPDVVAARAPFDWERFIGVRLPVWLGALALSLAGFFFVRYSIEAGLLTPAFRVFAALIAAFGFMMGAEVVRCRVKMDNGPAIAAALAAAGVATLFATAYLASVVYELVPLSAGFVAMAAATAVGIGIALIFGRTVAIVGMLGGYVTPALIPSDQPSAAMLFGYLTAILVGIFVVIRRKDWWNISLVALLGPALWIIAWTGLPRFEADHIWGSAFLIGISAVVLVTAYPHWAHASEPLSLSKTKGRSVSGGQAVLAAVGLSSLGFLVLLSQSQYIMPFWQGLFAFSALMVALAFIQPLGMRLLPLAPLAATALAMLGWDNAVTASVAVLVPIFAALFAFFALDQFRRQMAPLLAAGTMAFTALFFYLVALSKTVGWQAALEQPHLWALGALALAAGLLALLWRFGPGVADIAVRNRVYAVLASAVTAFVALVIVLELDPLYYPAAAALQVLGLAYVHRKTGVDTLRLVAIGLSALYALLILGIWQPDAALTFERSLAFASPSDSPWVLLILPGLAFIGAGHLFRRDERDRFADVLDAGGLAVAAWGVALLGRVDDIAFGAAHMTAARIAAPKLILAAGAIVAGRYLSRRVLYISGLVLTIVIILGMAMRLVLPLYTFWPMHAIPGLPVFNIALLSLGLPALMLLGIGWFVRQDTRSQMARTGVGISIVGVFYLFTLMLLDIRHAFHPQNLQGLMSDAESYSYSIGMLAFGAALLVIGVAIRNLGARALSFVFVLAATIKVFLFDAAGLEGLWRVLSFFGMGLSFLAISWLYARFVFGLGRKADAQTDNAT